MDEKSAVERVDAAYEKLTAANARIKSLEKKLADGTLTMKEGAELTDLRAQAFGTAFSGKVLDIAQDERESACTELLRKRCDDTDEVAKAAQRAALSRQGLNLTPPTAPFEEDRARKIGHSLEDDTVPDETIQRRAKSATETMIRSQYDRNMKQGAKTCAEAGLKTYIIRDSASGCCKWCDEVAGKFAYGSEPKDVYRRHDNCTCSVVYESGRGRQNVWSKQYWSAEQEREYLRLRDELKAKKLSEKPNVDAPVRLSAKEVRSIIDNVKRKFDESKAAVLTAVGKRDKIETKDLGLIASAFPSKKDLDGFLDLLNRCPNEDVRRAYINYASALTSCTLTKDDGFVENKTKLTFCFSSSAEQADGLSKYSILAHEFGHVTDQNGNFDGIKHKERDTLNDAIKSLYGDDRFTKAFYGKASTSDSFLAAIRKDRAELEKQIQDIKSLEDMCAKCSGMGVQDALSGMFGNAVFKTPNATIIHDYHHDDDYYNRVYDQDIRYASLEIRKAFESLGYGKVSRDEARALIRDYEIASEAWANIQSAETCGGDELVYMKKYLPNAYQEYFKIMKGMK